MTPKLCPECEQHFDDPTLSVCPDDGTRLITIHSHTLQPGTLIEGRFEILRHLGAGGMGDVYAAQQINVERDVAIKVIKPGQQDEVALKRFFREARTTSALAHPNTVRVFDFGQTEDGLVYIVMELLEGRTLKELLIEDNPLRPARVAHILAQACDSLAEAHEKGIIHRDLKPDNLFLKDAAGQKDFLKILDFGIAKFGVSDAASTLSGSGQIVGTPYYMAPEMISGKEATTAVDIYALGAVLYEALGGAPPYLGDNSVEVMFKQITGQPPSLMHLPYMTEALHDFLMRTLSKDIERRPPTALSFKDELWKLIPHDAEGVVSEHAGSYDRQTGSDTVVSGTVSVDTGEAPVIETHTDRLSVMEEPQPPAQPSRRRLWVALAVGLALVVAVIAAVLLTGGEPVESGRDAAQATLSVSLVLEASEDAGWLLEASSKLLSEHLRERGIEVREGGEGPSAKLTLDNKSGLVTLTLRWDDPERPSIRSEPARINRLYAEVDAMAFAIHTALATPETVDAPSSYAGRVRVQQPEGYAAWQAMVRAFRDELPKTAKDHHKTLLEVAPELAMGRADYAYWSTFHYGEVDEAQKVIGEVMQGGPFEPFVELYLQAVKAYVHAEDARLLGVLDDLLRRFPREALFHEILFDELEAKREYDAFTQAAETLKGVDPIYARSRYFRDSAIMLSYAGKHEEALEHLEIYIATRPWLVTSYQDQGDLLRNAGRYEEAIRAYERAISIAPSSWLTMFVSNVLYRQGRADAAIERIGPSLSAEDAFEAEEALMILLDIGYETFDPRGLVEREMIPRLAQRDPEEMPIARAFVDVFEGRLDKATQGARAALESGMTTWRHYYAYWLLLEVMIARKQVDLALNQVDKVCRHMEIGYYSVDDCELLRADTLLRLDEPKRALTPLQRALDYNPIRGRTHFLLGLAHERSNAQDEARTAYERFLDLWKHADPELWSVQHARQYLSLE